MRALPTHCKNGHEYTAENTRVVNGGSRQCRACDKAKAQAKRDADRGDKPKFFKPRQPKCKRGHLMEGENVKWVTDPWGKPQRQCRACEKLRNEGYRKHIELVRTGEAEPKEAGPRQRELCKYGHPMEGDNVYIRPDGTGRQCATCRLMYVKQYNARNPEAVANRKSNAYRDQRLVEFKAIKREILRLRGTMSDRELALPELVKILKGETI